MRIITGSRKGMKLKTPGGEEVTRPTAERVKEALFSMINFDLEGARVLDLFGGSGQLALEALSRGASYALIADADKEAVGVIRENVAKTKFVSMTRVIPSDYKRVIDTMRTGDIGGRFDIVFLDPPYASGFIPDALRRLVAADLLSDRALIVCESDSDKPVTYEGFVQKRFARYGRVYITLLEKEGTL